VKPASANTKRVKADGQKPIIIQGRTDLNETFRVIEFGLIEHWEDCGNGQKFVSNRPWRTKTWQELEEELSLSKTYKSTWMPHEVQTYGAMDSAIMAAKRRQGLL
jgi:hypothetical protein